MIEVETRERLSDSVRHEGEQNHWSKESDQVKTTNMQTEMLCFNLCLENMNSEKHLIIHCD